MRRPMILGLLLAASAAGTLQTGCYWSFGDENNSSPPPTASKPPPSKKPQVTTSAPHDVFEMNASMSAQSDGQSVKVYAALLLGTDFVVLDPGDYFSATLDSGESIAMVREANTDDKVHYVATFPAPSAATDVVVAFHRPKGRTGAPYSVVRIAPKFDITTAPPVRVRSSDVLDIGVSPAPLVDDDMKIQFYGDCVPSGGPFPILFDSKGKGSFFVSQVAFTGNGCDVRVEVRHETIGKVDSVFHRDFWGAIEDMNGLQARSISTAIMR